MVTPDSVGRALMDVSRRSHGLPTREENLAALAEQELARRKALADAGLAETNVALKQGELEYQPTAQGQETAESTAKIGQAEAMAGAANERGAYYKTQAERPQDFAPGHSYQDEAGDWQTAPMTPSQQGSGAAGLRLVTMPDPDDPTREIQKWVRPEEGVAYGKQGDTDARLEKVGQIVNVLGGLALRLNEGIDPSVSGRIQGMWMKFSAALNLDPDAQVYGDSLAGAASQLAKAFGESGRLSDQDIQRTVNMFPRPGDSEEVTRRKLKIIDILVGVGVGDRPLQKGSIESINAQRKNTAVVDQLVASISGGPNRTEPGGGVVVNPNSSSQELGGLDPEVMNRVNSLFTEDE